MATATMTAPDAMLQEMEKLYSEQLQTVQPQNEGIDEEEQDGARFDLQTDLDVICAGLGQNEIDQNGQEVFQISDEGK